MPVIHAQVPFTQFCPVGQVTLAHGSIGGLPALLLLVPAMLLIAPPDTPPSPEGEGEPPAETLMPLLASAPPPPDTEAIEPPAPAWVAGAPLEPTGAPPVFTGSLGAPELQATKQSNAATERNWGPGFDQE